MKKLVMAVLAGAALLTPLQAPLAQPKPAAPIADRDIYGSSMMTPEERDAYRRRIAAAETAQERERNEREHRERMIERAKARGIKLKQ